MDADTPAVRTGPHPWLLAALGMAVVALVASIMWPQGSAGTGLPSSNPTSRVQPGDSRPEAIDPAELEIRLEALEAERPAPGEAERNPFRFQPRPPPASSRLGPGGSAPPPMVQAPPVPQVPPGPPPIPIKFIGIVEEPGGRIAALSDCRAATWAKREGEVIDGRYRVVTIGIESIVIEYLDGTGRQTIRMTGDCPPR